MDFEQVLKKAQRAATSSLRTALPAEVVTYDRKEQRASVQVAVDFRYIDPETDELVFERPPTIPNCPVAFPSAADFSFTFPLEKGDSVLVVFCERSIDEWLETGASRTQPADTRRHDLSDAVVLPGLRPFADPIDAADTDDDAAVLACSNGKEIHFGTANPTSFIALAEKVANILSTREGTYNGHGHQYLAPSSPAGLQTTGSTDSPMSTTTEADVASTKVKSE